MTVWKSQNYGGSEETQWSAGIWEEGWTGGAQRVFRAMHTFCIVAVDICHYYCCLVTKPRLALWDPMDCSLPGSSVCCILQARLLEWVALFFSRGSSQPRDWTYVSCIAGRFFTTEPPGKPQGKDLTRKKQEQRQVSEFSSPPWSHALPHGIILFRLLCALLQACDLYSALSISFLFFPSPWGWGPWVVAFVSFIIPNAILSTCSSSS